MYNISGDSVGWLMSYYIWQFHQNHPVNPLSASTMAYMSYINTQGTLPLLSSKFQIVWMNMKYSALLYTCSVQIQ